jgi:hypothetical protein
MNHVFVPLLISCSSIIGAMYPQSARAATPLAVCDETSLRSAIAPGGPVLFDCDGTIVLTSPLVITNDVTLDANGRSVILSGGNAVRLFSINSNATLTLLGLTLVEGRAQAGGGILNDRGIVHLANCTVANHNALGTTSDQGIGGFILNRTGAVSAVSCVFSNNVARGGTGGVLFGLSGAGGTAAAGGVIADEGGQIHLSNCVFTANSAIGGDGGDFPLGFGGCGAPASGGVISSTDGTIDVRDSRFLGNRATGGSTGAGGTGGNGGIGGASFGGAVAGTNAQLSILRSQFVRNEAGGGNGGRTQPGGNAQGGALACESGDSRIAQSSFTENRSLAGYGRQDSGASATARGGAFFTAGTSTVYQVTFATNSAWGAPASGRPGAGAAGNGEGGGLHNAGSIRISQTTFAGNSAKGGSGTIKEGFSFPVIFGAGGNGSGGAIQNGGSLAATNLTLANNRAEAGPGAVFPLTGQTGPGGVAIGGGINNTSDALLADSIIAYSFGPNCSGPIGDGGHNISSDSSCNFAASGGQNNSDPKLGPLADNGGPTLTIALLPGSPAINAGSEANCAPVDQRGVSRPAHGRCDIGAFELVLNDFTLTSITKGTVAVTLQGQGPPGVEFTIQGSSRFEQWDHLADASVQTSGLFHVLIPVDETHQFFRVAQRRSGGAGSP